MNTLLIPRRSDGPDWAKLPVLCELHYPWDEDATLAKTHFKAYHTGEDLHFQFTAFADKVLIYRKVNDKLEVRFSERVELFFSEDAALQNYYCLEMDPALRVLDYQAKHYRAFNRNWQWPESLNLICRSQADAYLLSGSINLKTLTALKLLKGNVLKAGIYRGHVLSLQGEDADIRWSSWLKPEAREPDFHIPSSFGKWLLEQ
jgi:hypothetical protein